MKRILTIVLSLVTLVTTTLCAQSLSVLSSVSSQNDLTRGELQALAALNFGLGGEIPGLITDTQQESISEASSESSSLVSSVPSSSSKAVSSSKVSSSKVTSSSRPASSSTPVPSSSVPSSSSSVPSSDVYQTAVMGTKVATAEQMATYLLKYELNPKINGTVWDLVNYFLSEGQTEGVRGDIAFCQSLHETGWFRYGGQVQPYQNNYAGIGATNGGPQGASFPSPQIGVRAQIQHLKAYGSTASLVNALVDPRFSLVSRGCAPLWTSLSGRWAVPGYGAPYTSLAEAIAAHADYGSKILQKYIAMTSTPVDAALVSRAKTVVFSAT